MRAKVITFIFVIGTLVSGCGPKPQLEPRATDPRDAFVGVWGLEPSEASNPEAGDAPFEVFGITASREITVFREATQENPQENPKDKPMEIGTVLGQVRTNQGKSGSKVFLVLDRPVSRDAVYELKEIVIGPHSVVRHIELVRDDGLSRATYRYRKFTAEECKPWADKADRKFKLAPTRQRKFDLY